MYAVAVSATEAIAVDDADPDWWTVHRVDFAARTIAGFSFSGLGKVQSAFHDAVRDLLWVIVEGTVFAIKPSAGDIFTIDTPDEPFFAYGMTGGGDALYVCGEYTNIWRLDLPGLDWQPVSRPGPPPPKVEDPDAQSRQVKDYARRHPPYYAAFTAGDAHVFCGALGALARVRGGTLETSVIDTGARLVAGQAEGTGFALSADTPAGEIYVGSFEAGFERIFSDDLRAFNRTALLDGRRYVGVAEYPPSSVHNLYVLNETGPVEVTTGCAREPGALVSLTRMGSSLWAIDGAGLFRLSGGAWALCDIGDMRRGVWPETP